MTSSNGNIFHITGPLWGESTGHKWIPLTKASDFKLWCFLWSAPKQMVEQMRQSRCQWFEGPSCSLWSDCNGTNFIPVHYSGVTWASRCLITLADQLGFFSTACSRYEQRKPRCSALLALCKGKPLVTPLTKDQFVVPDILRLDQH